MAIKLETTGKEDLGEMNLGEKEIRIRLDLFEKRRKEIMEKLAGLDFDSKQDKDKIKNYTSKLEDLRMEVHEIYKKYGYPKNENISFINSVEKKEEDERNKYIKKAA